MNRCPCDGDDGGYCSEGYDDGDSMTIAVDRNAASICRCCRWLYSHRSIDCGRSCHCGGRYLATMRTARLVSMASSANDGTALDRRAPDDDRLRLNLPFDLDLG